MIKKKKKGKKKTLYGELKSLIQELMNDQKNKRLSHKQVIKKLGVKDNKTKNDIKSILIDLNKNKHSGRKSSSAPVSGQEIIGKVDFVNPRFAYIVSEDMEKDVMVKSENLKFAFDDDTVRVHIFKSKSMRGKSVV